MYSCTVVRYRYSTARWNTGWKNEAPGSRAEKAWPLQLYRHSDFRHGERVNVGEVFREDRSGNTEIRKSYATTKYGSKYGNQPSIVE